MSHKADRARLEFVLDILGDIDLITQRHISVDAALDDREGFHALMMCCLQIGETLNKIEDAIYRGKLPVSLAYTLRNIIAHDYLGISKKRISETISVSIPELRDIVERLLAGEQGADADSH